MTACRTLSETVSQHSVEWPFNIRVLFKFSPKSASIQTAESGLDLGLWECGSCVKNWHPGQL